MFLEINLKKYKETPEGVQNIIGLVGLTATIIFIFSILNLFTFGERDKAAESDKSREINTKVLSKLPKGRLNFFEERSHLTEYLSIKLPLSVYNCFAL